MSQINNIERRIEETINSLDGIKSATPQPFFYTRLKAQMDKLENEKSVWESMSSFITRPAMMLATVCVVLLLNVAVLYKNHLATVKGPTTDQVEQASSDAAYDVASNTNTTIYNIWSQDNDQHSQQ
ncbi:MAG: hypothetical protein QM764_05320 [Chitinophagaceae bacterium]